MKPPMIGPLHHESSYAADQQNDHGKMHTTWHTYKEGPAKLPIDQSDITMPRSFGAQMSVTMVPLVAMGPL